MTPTEQQDTPRPTTPQMLDLLAQAYATLGAQATAPAPERAALVARLAAIHDDLRWYAQRLGAERWERAPRPGRWSFAENLWHIVAQAQADAQAAPTAQPLVYYVDHAKEHVGQAAEIYALFYY